MRIVYVPKIVISNPMIFKIHNHKHYTFVLPSLQNFWKMEVQDSGFTRGMVFLIFSPERA